MDRHVEEIDYPKHSEPNSFCYDHNNPLSGSNTADSKPNTFFFSDFFRFLSTYGRNRLVGGSKIHRSDSKTRGIDVFYSS